MLNRGANAQDQIQGQFARGQFGELRMGKSILIVGSGFETADLVRESKRGFGLVVRLIANKCYV